MTYHAARTEGGADAPLLFTFHGTGGDEHQLHGLGQQLMPGARVVSPRGDVSEHGALRFFRRTGEGVYDMADLATRTAAMVDFVAAEKGGTETTGLGYSNGANILATTAIHAPELFDRLILLHPLIPFTPDPVDLSGTRILVTAGERDPICPAPLTRTFTDWLESQGAEVTTHWHPGGHELARSELDAIAAFLN